MCYNSVVIHSTQTMTTPYSEDQIQDLVFIDALIKAISGLSLQDIPDDKKTYMVEQSLSIYQNYIVGYFKENFETRDALRIQQILKEENTTIFDKFPDMQTKFDEAYQSFLNYLK
jgi:hypothetical protein